DGKPDPDQYSLADPRRFGIDATIREGTRRAAARSSPFGNHTHDGGAAATDAHDPDRVRQGFRPVGSGFVASFAEPGGNVTGFTSIEPSMPTKWLQLLKEIAPRVARVAVLFNPATAPYAAEFFLKPIKAAASSLAMQAITAPVRDTSDMESVIAK